jgi:hypothetical protein
VAVNRVKLKLGKVALVFPKYYTSQTTRRITTRIGRDLPNVRRLLMRPKKDGWTCTATATPDNDQLIDLVTCLGIFERSIPGKRLGVEGTVRFDGAV